MNVCQHVTINNQQNRYGVVTKKARHDENINCLIHNKMNNTYNRHEPTTYELHAVHLVQAHTLYEVVC